jgi:hypothetical protein
MSHSINETTDKHQKHPKVQTKQYLYSSDESESNYHNSSGGLEFEMLENSYSMKQRIRRHAQRMRNLSY